MSDIKRVRGDNYPFIFTLSINDTVVDISGDTVTFNYDKDNKKTITGVLDTDGTDGRVKFIPTANDFLESGVFNYDVQRVSGGYTYTHAKGKLILDEDI